MIALPLPQQLRRAGLTATAIVAALLLWCGAAGAATASAAWAPVPRPASASWAVYDAWAFGAAGLAVTGDDGHIAVTRNAGQSWTEVVPPGMGATTFTAVVLDGTGHGAVASGGELLVTSDGGKTWHAPAYVGPAPSAAIQRHRAARVRGHRRRRRGHDLRQRRRRRHLATRPLAYQRGAQLGRDRRRRDRRRRVRGGRGARRIRRELGRGRVHGGPGDVRSGSSGPCVGRRPAGSHRRRGLGRRRQRRWAHVRHAAGSADRGRPLFLVCRRVVERARALPAHGGRPDGGLLRHGERRLGLRLDRAHSRAGGDAGRAERRLRPRRRRAARAHAQRRPRARDREAGQEPHHASARPRGSRRP